MCMTPGISTHRVTELGTWSSPVSCAWDLRFNTNVVTKIDGRTSRSFLKNSAGVFGRGASVDVRACSSSAALTGSTCSRFCNFKGKPD